MSSPEVAYLLAATRALIQRGAIKSNESVVVCITGNGYKTAEVMRDHVERPVQIGAGYASVGAGSHHTLALKPDGIFLTNGPGDPAAVKGAREAVAGLLGKVPVFGICLGHQIMGLALGGRTFKLKFGHHGANQPVKDLTTGKVEITSQNHGFCVVRESLPENVKVTHESLFDGCVEGLEVEGRPIFSVQYHPEASPGPKDSHYLFDRFIKMMAFRG